jgi:hypothetical protein
MPPRRSRWRGKREDQTPEETDAEIDELLSEASGLVDQLKERVDRIVQLRRDTTGGESDSRVERARRPGEASPA